MGSLILSLVAGETATSFSIGDQTFTIGSERTIVRYADDQVAVVVPTGTETITVSPGPTTDPVTRYNWLTGGAINGAMVNPVGTSGNTTSSVPEGDRQAFDERRPTTGVNYNAANAAALPATCSAGDVFVSVISDTTVLTADADGRSGQFQEYAAVYFVSNAPNSTALAPEALGWPGRSSLEDSGPINWTAEVAALPNYALPSYSAPDYETEIKPIGAKFNPGSALTNIDTVFGYENTTPTDWGYYAKGSFNSTTHANYSRYLAQRLSIVEAALMSDKLTSAQKVEKLKHYTSFGKQFWGTRGSIGPVGASGGAHWQFPFGACATYLKLTGNTSALDALHSTVQTTLISQSFQLTRDFIDAKCQPFGDPTDLTDGGTMLDYPYNFHWRRIQSVSGNQVVVKGYQGGIGGIQGDSGNSVPQGLIMTDDSANQATITAASRSNFSGGFWDWTITLDSNPFSTGNDIYMGSPYQLRAGDPAWTQKPIAEAQYFNPSNQAAYRNLNFWAGQMLLLQALGLMRDEWLPARNYVLKTSEGNFPTASHEFPTMLGSPFIQAVWDDATARAAILAVPQPALTISAPSAFGTGDWSVSGNTVTLSTVPTGAVGVWYDVDGDGAWIDCGRITAGTFSLGLSAGTYDIRLAVINERGEQDLAISAAKSTTI